jgi:hypothetical protein
MSNITNDTTSNGITLTTDGTLINEGQGLISSQYSGVYMEGGSPAYVANSGIIISRGSAGSGIFMPRNGSIGTVVNAGTIIATGASSKGIANGIYLNNSGLILAISAGLTPDYRSTVFNTGTIMATGRSGSVATGIEGDKVFLENGGLIYGVDTGVSFYGSTVINTGTIRAVSSTSIGILANDVYLKNSGLISGVNTAANISGSMVNTGTISGYLTGVQLSASALTNSGIITASSSSDTASGVNCGSNVTLDNQAGGIIRGYIGVEALDLNPNTLQDQGVNNTLYNAGSIFGAYWGVQFNQSTLTNSGLISTFPPGDNSGTSSTGVGAMIDSDVVLNNQRAGIISGNIGVEAFNGDVIENSGTIIGTTWGVRLVGGGDVLINQNIIKGGVSLAYNGELELFAGQSISGSVEAVGGFLALGSSATVGTLEMGGSFSGLTKITFNAGAIWTLGGTSTELAGGQTITGFAVNDMLELVGFTASSHSFVAGSGLELGNGSSEITLDLTGSFTSAEFSISATALGTDITYSPMLPAQATAAVASTLDLGQTHVGTVVTKALSIANSGTGEGLDAKFAGTTLSSGTVTTSGTLTALPAGTTNNTALEVTLGAAVAGTAVGSAFIALASDGTGIDSNGTTSLGTDTIALSGAVFNYAAPTLRSASVNLGIIHVGSAATQALSLSNGSTSSAYTEKLDAAFLSVTGTGALATGSVATLASGGSSSALSVGFSGSDTGLFSGRAVLGFTSDGTGIDNLGTTVLSSDTITLTGTVDNYATATLAELSGAGTLTGIGNNFTLALGSLQQGHSSLVANLEVLNVATGFADQLGGGFTIANAGSAFTDSGFSNFSSLSAGQADVLPSITLSGTSAGSFSETIIVVSTGSNASGYSGTLANSTLTVTGTVTDNPICFVRGTRLATPQGDTAVEELHPGDEVCTPVGPARVRWIGRRAYDGRFINGNHLALPVTIKVGALGENIPVRDLHVSPGHGIWIAGVLVPAWRLVNGLNVIQAQAVDTVEYYHVELQGHGLLLAHGVPVESFLDNGLFRSQFQNAAEYWILYPCAPANREVTPLPRVEEGFMLAAIRASVNQRAGLAVMHDLAGHLRGSIDEISAEGFITGWAQDETSPEDPVVLTAYADGSFVTNFIANVYRPDLRQAGLGSGCHGFRLQLPARSGGKVEITRAADGAALMRLDTAHRNVA